MRLTASDLGFWVRIGCCATAIACSDNEHAGFVPDCDRMEDCGPVNAVQVAGGGSVRGRVRRLTGGALAVESSLGDARVQVVLPAEEGGTITVTVDEQGEFTAEEAERDEGIWARVNVLSGGVFPTIERVDTSKGSLTLHVVDRADFQEIADEVSISPSSSAGHALFNFGEADVQVQPAGRATYRRGSGFSSNASETDSTGVALIINLSPPSSGISYIRDMGDPQLFSFPVGAQRFTLADIE
jgi:hypothetical protein